MNLYRQDPQKPIKKADKKPIKKADRKPIKKADKKPITQERQQKILNYVKEHGAITNKEAREMLELADSTTKRILKQMVQEELLDEQGERKTRIYVLR